MSKRDKIVHLDSRKKDSEPAIPSLLKKLLPGWHRPRRINESFAYYTGHVLAMWAIVHDRLLSLVSTPVPWGVVTVCLDTLWPQGVVVALPVAPSHLS